MSKPDRADESANKDKPEDAAEPEAPTRKGSGPSRSQALPGALSAP